MPDSGRQIEGHTATAIATPKLAAQVFSALPLGFSRFCTTWQGSSMEQTPTAHFLHLTVASKRRDPSHSLAAQYASCDAPLIEVSHEGDVKIGPIRPRNFVPLTQHFSGAQIGALS
jgi:hypothetical protein